MRSRENKKSNCAFVKKCVVEYMQGAYMGQTQAGCGGKPGHGLTRGQGGFDETAGVHSGKFRIPLPGKEYMAVRLTRI